MQVRRIDITSSPGAPDRLRLCGEITYADRAFATERYWFDVPRGCADYLSTSGNPWLVSLLPLAVTLGEPIEIGMPVDSILVENARELMSIWRCWHPHLQPVALEVDICDTIQHDVSRTAAFFSGGVDSFFTVLQHTPDSSHDTTGEIEDLLSVWGFDVPLSNEPAFRRMRDRLQRAASDLATRLVDVATNLRETRWNCTDWARLSHNCALASVALALENGYSKVFIASTGGYYDLLPWGSHVLTDPLLSTSTTRIVHDGAAYKFTEKVEVVARSDVAMRSLRVCWRARSDENCCDCNKCYRTMITLELLGHLGRCDTFSKKKLQLPDVRSIYSPEYYDFEYYRDIQALAERKGRHDIANAIEVSLRRSARLLKYSAVIRFMKKQRVIWRFAQRLERALLARHIR